MIPAMPTLPLLKIPSDPDAWHQVRAPGGYEGWFFKADDKTAKVQITGFIGQGCRFEGAYRKQYNRYRKHPTKTPPPLPSDFAACQWHIQDKIRYAPTNLSGPFQASTDHLALAIGKNHLTSEGKNFHLKLSNGNEVSVELTIMPTSQRLIVTPEVLQTRHRWTQLQNCQVAGTINVAGKSQSFQGTGTLEHRYGTEPITTQNRTEMQNGTGRTDAMI